jgi:TRAP-type mannitol/chloroaromatic compound transport system permease large subunit
LRRGERLPETTRRRPFGIARPPAALSQRRLIFRAVAAGTVAGLAAIFGTGIYSFHMMTEYGHDHITAAQTVAAGAIAGIVVGLAIVAITEWRARDSR